MRLANPGVAVVYYKYEETTLKQLLSKVGKELDGEKAMCIALMMHGQSCYFKVTTLKVRTIIVLSKSTS